MYFADPLHSFDEEHELNGRAVRTTIAANIICDPRSLGTGSGCPVLILGATRIWSANNAADLIASGNTRTAHNVHTEQRAQNYDIERRCVEHRSAHLARLEPAMWGARLRQAADAFAVDVPHHFLAGWLRGGRALGGLR